MHRLALCLVLLSAGPAAQQTYWVDAVRGSDTNPGTAAQPLRSITQAVGFAGAGDRILVVPGTYGPATTGEMLPIVLGAVPQAGLEVRGLGGPGAVLVDLAQSKSQMFRIDMSAAGARIVNFRFTNSDTTDWWTRVIDTVGNASPVDIERCIFDGVNRGIVVWGASSTVTGMRIHHNLFVGMANDAINEFGSSCANDVFHNTIVGTPQGPNFVGILTEAMSSRHHDNIVVGMRDGFLTSQGAQPANFRGNDVWNNQNDWAGSIGTAPPGNFSLDPMFVGAARGDYRLQAASPLLDRGAGVLVGLADAGGIPAAVDGDGDSVAEPDVGAHEYSPATHTVTSGAGTTTFTVSGPAGVGVLLFGLEEGRVPLPGGSWALLDPAASFPLTLTGGLPLSASAPTPQHFPGARVLTQGLVFEPVNLTVLPGESVSTLF